MSTHDIPSLDLMLYLSVVFSSSLGTPYIEVSIGRDSRLSSIALLMLPNHLKYSGEVYISICRFSLSLISCAYFSFILSASAPPIWPSTHLHVSLVMKP